VGIADALQVTVGERDCAYAHQFSYKNGTRHPTRPSAWPNSVADTLCWREPPRTWCAQQPTGGRNQRRRCVGCRSAFGVAAMPRGPAHRVLACVAVLFGTFLCRRVGQSTSGMLGLRSRGAHTRGRAATAAECRFIAKWRRPAFVWGANSLLFEPGHRFVHFGYWAHYFMSDRHADDRFFRVLRVCARASVRAACLFVSLYFGCSCVCAMRCALRAARHYYQDGMASIKQFAIECAFAAVRSGALSACPSRNGRTD
jgi:hypothetical protein